MTPYDLIGKEISWSYNWKDQEAYFKLNNRTYRLYYPNLWGEDVSLKASYILNMKGKLKKIDHSYFLNEDSLTTNEKYVFIFGENCKTAVMEWDIHYNDVDQFHIAEFQRIKGDD